MKVYVVRAYVGENYEDRESWTCGVFASKKAAERYVNEQPEKFTEDAVRIHELDILMSTRELTDEENEEYQKRQNNWVWRRTCPTYYIDEFELQGVEP